MIMKKDAVGVIAGELCTVRVCANVELLENVFAMERGGKVLISMTLTVDPARELSDWEFDAVFDYYDTEILDAAEVSDCADPAWTVEFAYEDAESAQAAINQALDTHSAELAAVFEVIKDKENDYI